MQDPHDANNEWDDTAPGGSDLEAHVPKSAVGPGQVATFAFVRGGEPFTGFVVVGADGAPRAYVNHCPHVPYPLDFGDGEVLDHDRRTIVCANPGARFDPSDGRCIWGPARGRGLEQLPLREDGDVLRISIAPEPAGWPFSGPETEPAGP